MTDLIKDPIAIIGIGCRFPGQVRNAESYWNLLIQKRSGIIEIPEDRWNSQKFYHADGGITGTMHTRWGGFIHDYDQFDATFFGIAPREADRMDPQQRWLLEVTWETIENAGIDADDLRGSDTGVFIGMSSSDYGIIQMDRANWPLIDVHTNSGLSLSIASNRISYLLDLHGPSLTLDSACSSALVAVDNACRSIWSGDCKFALAGGVNSIMLPQPFMGFTKAQMLSPTGQCHTFDQSADGYVRGEGAGMVLLKPLADALVDNDRIYAVIRSTAVLQDGNTSGMTIPSGDAQEALLLKALALAKINPEDIAYMEAHGTGTPIGDPIETGALGRVLSKNRPKSRPCFIGSVKTNIGHLEPASGIAGLIKTALILYHKKIPANLNFKIPNSKIPFEQYRLCVPTQTTPLPRINTLPIFAGVNSFGFGGTNAHVTLEEPPGSNPWDHSEKPLKPYLLTISARHKDALTENARAFQKTLDDDQVPLPDITYSAGARKTHHPYGLAVVGNTRKELTSGLEQFLSGKKKAPGLFTGKLQARNIDPIFVFTGQGSQWWGMGQQLFDQAPLFRSILKKIDRIFKELSGKSLLTMMQLPKTRSLIHRTDVAQPAIFAVQVGLVSLWEHFGIRPKLLVGHSVGEVAATFCAGIYSLEDAVKIIFHRSRLQQTLGGKGMMAAVGISEEQAALEIRKFKGHIDISAVNSPAMVTLSGETTAMNALLEIFKQQGQFFKILPIDFAFHSSLMEPVREPLLDALADICPSKGHRNFISTVTGTIMSGKDLDAQYWWQNIRQPVLFNQAIHKIAKKSLAPMLEIGPHPSLQTSMAECCRGEKVPRPLFHSLSRNQDDGLSLMKNLAQMHLCGIPMDWGKLTGSNRLVDLPGYCWQHRTHWAESEISKKRRLDPPLHPFFHTPVTGPRLEWRGSLTARKFEYLKEHRIWDQMVFPAAGYAEMGLALAQHLSPGTQYVVEDLTMKQALFLPEDQELQIRIQFDDQEDKFSIYSSLDENEWELHAQGRTFALNPPCPEPVNLNVLSQTMTQKMSHEECYNYYKRAGLLFGHSFRQVKKIRYSSGQSLVQVIVPQSIQTASSDYCIHPTVLDAFLHGAQACHQPIEGRPKSEEFYLPARFKRICLYQPSVPGVLWVHTRAIEDSAFLILCDIIVYDEQGRTVAQIHGFQADFMEKSSRDQDVTRKNVYHLEWEDTQLFKPKEQPYILPEKWHNRPILIFCDKSGTGNELVDRINGMNHPVIRIEQGDKFHCLESNTYTIRPDSGSDFEKLMADLAETSPAAIIHLWTLDQPGAQDLTAQSLATAQNLGTLNLWQVAQHLGTTFSPTPDLILIVTRNTQSVNSEDTLDGLAGSTVTGFSRTACNEYSETRWKLLDLESRDSIQNVSFIINEACIQDNETEIAFRRNKRLVRRLKPIDLDRMPLQTRPVDLGQASPTPVGLELSKSGSLNQLCVTEITANIPGPHEIQVQVGSCGINFRDIMKLLGIYPGNSPDHKDLGDDFSGTILKCGTKVKGLAPGDRICGITSGAFKTVLTMDAGMVIKIPDHISFSQAATLPTVILTAHYALCRLAHLGKSETVLIHAATGGVGQAAIQVARHRGATILATAGNSSKKQFLRSQGIDHVMDSRSLNFAEDVLSATNGRGVDVILNSLAGKFIDKNLSVLAPFGRYVEIGKKDIYENRPLGMEAFKDNISFFVIDLGQMITHGRHILAELFDQVTTLLGQGVYTPLKHKVFPLDQAKEAFHYMTRAKHMGKVILSFDKDVVQVISNCRPGALFSSDATYLITGGAAGVGLELARWMGNQGARHLLLISRSGPHSSKDHQIIARLKEKKIQVTDARCDITDLDRLNEIIRNIDTNKAPLKGIFHCAAILEDEFITDLPASRVMTVMGPKILGAWNLHTATRNSDLNFFVSFSSVSSITGSVRQGNYAAANSFLDAFSHYLRYRSIPAITVNFGPIKGAGMIQRNEQLQQYIEQTGLGFLEIKEVWQIISQLLTIDTPQVMASPIDWSKLSHLSDFIGQAPLFSKVRKSIENQDREATLYTRLSNMPRDKRLPEMEDFLTRQIADVFGSEMSQIDQQTPINKLGLDSLMAVEVMNRVESAVQRSIPLSRLLAGPTISELAGLILKTIHMENPSVDPYPKTVKPNIQEPGENQHLEHGLSKTLSPKMKTDTTSTSVGQKPLSADAVAINYLHDKLCRITGLSKPEILKTLVKNQPQVTEIYQLKEGRIAMIRLPFFEEQLLKKPEGLEQALRETLDLARAMSASSVALTGILPSITRNGLAMKDLTDPNAQIITTGDATRVATVLFSIQGILSAADREMNQETLSWVGLSPFSLVLLRLMLEKTPHPRSITICDPFRSMDTILNLAEGIKAEGFTGKLSVLPAQDELPPDIYQSSLIVGATSWSNALDVKQLSSATLLVDYSFPSLFDSNAAWERVENRNDILFTDGAHLRLNQSIEYRFIMPVGPDSPFPKDVEITLEETSHHPFEIEGCVLTSLLSAAPHGMAPTLGPVTLDAARQHYDYLKHLLVAPANLQMEPHTITKEQIRAFKNNYRSGSIPMKGKNLV